MRDSALRLAAGLRRAAARGLDHGLRAADEAQRRFEAWADRTLTAAEAAKAERRAAAEQERQTKEARAFTSPLGGEVDAASAAAGEGASRSPERSRPPHPALRADLSKRSRMFPTSPFRLAQFGNTRIEPGRGEERDPAIGRGPNEAQALTSPRRGEVDAASAAAGEGVSRSPERSRPPHPALRADLSPLGRGEEGRPASTKVRRPFSWRNALLGLDSWLDDTVWKSGPTLSRKWDSVCAAFDGFRVRGWRRWTVELACEGLTMGAVAATLLLALAVPAFQETGDDWLSRADLSVTFLDRHGVELGKRGVMQNDGIPLSEYPDHLIKAALATEDRRFYQHFGIDVAGTLRAIVTNAKANGVRQGGSSITQQLAKNIFLSNERTLERKIKEAFLALWLEHHLSKDEILKLYLDRAYMGGGAFGVDAAAHFYFGKSAKEVTLAESAMLAGLFKAPTKFAPHVNLAAARARANQVLDNLVDAGFMTEGQVQAARFNPATPVAVAQASSPDYYLDWAFNEVRQMAKDGAFGDQRVLTVRTALDPALQRHAEGSIEQMLRQYGDRYDVDQAAAVVMEPEGAVRAMVGGRDYGQSQFNRAVDALRQPGSSFKTYVYAAAFASGRYTPDSVIVDAPFCVGNWCPRNYGRRFAGKVQLINAYARSINTVPVRLALAIGQKPVIDIAHRMGIRTKLDPGRALALGVEEVTVLDHTSAYATIANGGRRAPPYAAIEVADSKGDVVWRRDRDGKKPEQALAPYIVADMTRMMLAVTEGGTGGRARLDGFQVCGKTGTSQSYRDAWFVGFTGSLVGGVWFGNDDFTATREMTGGSLPAMTWKDIMTFAHQGFAPRPIPGLKLPAGGQAVASQAPADSGDSGLSRSRNLTDDAARVLNAIVSDVAAAGGPKPERASLILPAAGAGAPVVTP
ncbi:transglycosylase domain-containing protein [Hansschlegelia plantiphila]|uniref:transglycosylase domain-containing protein n=1 Tax=Hansschlegelia plantiphila TaxID=374655 RepID=UPI0022F24958|nr:PBP1A family penicillin-binding protein [Hansschlegelia plantiphila]